MERKACIHGLSCGWETCMMEDCPEFKQRPQKKCEHIIGLYSMNYGRFLVSLPDLKRYTRDFKAFNARYKKTRAATLQKNGYWLKDYADKKKSTNLTRFNFCPMCGEKIDWAAIKRIDNE